MVRDLNLFFDSANKEYWIVSAEGYVLKLNEKDFQAIKKSMNGISYALQLKSRRMHGQSKAE
jgi:hypothetical protein